MKFSILFRLFTAIAFLWLLTTSTAAQGAGFDTYTWIDYDEETNTVTAYSQTDVDYELAGDYTPRVTLTVTNEYGVVVANGYNTGSNGIASVELNFAGEAGRTYTAIGNHRAIISLWERDEFYPYTVYYFDTWYFTNFEGIGIYQPWYYYFTRPGYSIHQRQTATVSLGRTYDSASTTALSGNITFRTVSNDVNSNVANFSSGAGSQTATVNLSGASHTVCGANRTSFNITVNFDLPPGATSVFHPDARTFITDSDKQQFQYLSFNFDGTTFYNGKGKMNINVRQVRPTATDKGFKIRITGAQQSGGSYYGVARVNFTCP